MIKNLYFIVATTLLLGTATAQTILIQEDFSTNPPANTPSVTWTTTDVPPEGATNPYYIYGPAFARDVNMSAGYDNDNDPSTDSISIPGALELNGELADVTLTATIALPADLDVSTPGTLTFFAGTRTSSGESPTLSVTTDSNDALIDSVDILAPSSSTSWEFFSYSIDLTSTTPGENLIIDWTGGGDVDNVDNLGSASGLQLTDITFTVNPVPEPSSALLSLLGLALITRRRR